MVFISGLPQSVLRSTSLNQPCIFKKFFQVWSWSPKNSSCSYSFKLLICMIDKFSQFSLFSIYYSTFIKLPMYFNSAQIDLQSPRTSNFLIDIYNMIWQAFQLASLKQEMFFRFKKTLVICNVVSAFCHHTRFDKVDHQFGCILWKNQPNMARNALKYSAQVLYLYSHQSKSYIVHIFHQLYQ